MLTTNDPNIPFNNGSIRWDIPIIFKDMTGEPIGQTTVSQEYILENGTLTMKKGGQELFRIKLN